jgi:hypothetical protein
MVRLFKAALSIWDEFRGEYTALWTPNSSGGYESTNLCFFMRTILVWAPLVFLLHALMLFLAWVALWYFPASFFGAVVWAGYIGRFFLLVLGVWLLILGIKMLDEKMTVIIERRRKPPKPKPYKKPKIHVDLSRAKKVFQGIRDFSSLLIDWAWAQKKKICPTIKFTEPQSEKKS